MEQYIDILQHCYLFEHIEKNDIIGMIACLGGYNRTYQKGNFLLHENDAIDSIGIVLSGSVSVLRDDAFGNRIMIDSFFAGQVFKEALCLSKMEKSPVSIMAVTKTNVLILPFQHMLKTCAKSCPFHRQLIENLVLVLARKNIFLQEKLNILSKKTIREKITAYLQSIPHQKGNYISIPLNREQLANYLGVDRSALSRELSNMQEEGLLHYYKNQFKMTQHIDSGHTKTD